jgi:hypothetical protein
VGAASRPLSFLALSAPCVAAVCQAGRVSIRFPPHALHSQAPASLGDERRLGQRFGSNSWNQLPKCLIPRRKASGRLGEGRRSLNCWGSLRLKLKRLFVEPC